VAKRTERPKSFPPLPDFTDDAYYRVQLWRSIRYAGRMFTPAARQVVRGDIAKKIVMAIHTAEPARTP
jgi:hypothetical protein